MTTPDRGEDRDPDASVDGVVRAEYDWSSVSPNTAVIETVAIAADREPTALEPLHGTVDTDALAALVAPGARSTDGVTTVSFEFDGHGVTVRSDGTVVVEPAGSRRGSE